MIVTRRTVLTAGTLAAATTLIGGSGTSGYRGPARKLTIASGQPGGLYREFANLLAGQIDDLQPDLHCSVTETDGSVDNITMVHGGRADLAMTQADTAIAAVAGQGPFRSCVPIRSIGRVYEDYLQLVVRAADEKLKTFSDLAGRSVSIGAKGSGTALVSQRLITVTGIQVDPWHQKLADAITDLENHRISALIWAGGVPTPALAELHTRIRIRLLPTAELLPMLHSRFSTAYQQVLLPASGYGQAGVPTLGVANLLVCAKTLPDDVVGAVTRTLVTRADRLVPRQALGTQFLDPHTLIGTLDIPMHPGAADEYRELHG